MRSKTNYLTVAVFVVTLFFLGHFGSKTENRLVKKCEATENVRDCRIKKVVEIMNERGVRSAFVAVEKLKDADPEFGPICHAFVHEVGLEAYKNVLKGKNFFSMPISPCNYAYFHGLMMELVMHERTSKEADFKFANQVCRDMVKMSGGDSSIYYQCYHGVGHGLAPYHLLTSGKSVGNMIAESLIDCDKYFEAADFCKIGVYGGMSLFITGDHNLTVGDFDINDAFLLCRNQSKELRPSCYEMIAPALVFSTDGNIPKAVSIMKSNIKEDSERVVISRQLGQAVLSYNFDAGVDEMRDVCDQIPGESNTSCVEGFLNGYIDSRPKSDKALIVENFCKSSQFTANESSLCISIANQI